MDSQDNNPKNHEGSPTLTDAETPQKNRRDLLGTVILGSLAGVLASCSNADFNANTKPTAKAKGLVKKNFKDSPSPTNSANGENAGGRVTETSGESLDPNADPRPCLDISSVPSMTPNTFLKIANPAMYGSENSALLAMKFKSTQLSVGDLVNVFALRPADENQAVLIATRRVLSTDIYDDGVGIVFEGLSFPGFKKLVVTIVKGNTSSKFAIDPNQSFRKMVPDGAAQLPVLDLCDARDPGLNSKLFGLEYHVNAPRCPSNGRSNDQSLGSTGGSGGNLRGATKSSGFVVSSMVAPSGALSVRVEDIFGELIASPNDSNLLHKHQSVVVYCKKKKTVTGVGDVEGYLRYFFFIG